MNDQEDIKHVSLKWDFGMAPLMCATSLFNEPPTWKIH